MKFGTQVRHEDRKLTPFISKLVEFERAWMKLLHAQGLGTHVLRIYCGQVM